MTEMVDRVARALQERDETFEAGEPLDPAFIEDARAAIAAMREPSDPMLDRGYEKSGPIDGAIAYAVVAEIWRAMIDVILAEAENKD